jgi:hypothetical protein
LDYNTPCGSTCCGVKVSNKKVPAKELMKQYQSLR